MSGRGRLHRRRATIWAAIAAGGLGLVTVGCRTLDQEPFAATVARIGAARSLPATVAALARPLIDSGRNLGMVIAVSTPEGDGLYAFGAKDRAGRAPMTTDAVFQVGSVTKSFTALLAAQLEQEHLLALDEPVARLVPSTVLLGAADLGRVTFAELASHTSGMPHEAYTVELLRGLMSYLWSGKNLYRNLDTPALEAYLRASEFVAPTDKRYGYSNIGLVYLGWLLGHIDGRGFRRLLSDEVLRPLALRHTGLSLSGTGVDLTPGYAGDLPPFVARDEPVDPWLFDEGIAGAGGLHATAADLLAYAKAEIGVTPSPLAAAMAVTRRPRAPAEGGQIAMGWFLKILPVTQVPYTYVAGIIGGHTSFVGFDERRKIAVVVLQNSINHDDMIGVTLLDRLVGARLVAHEGLPLATLLRRASLRRPDVRLAGGAEHALAHGHDSK